MINILSGLLFSKSFPKKLLPLVLVKEKKIKHIFLEGGRGWEIFRKGSTGWRDLGKIEDSEPWKEVIE